MELAERIAELAPWFQKLDFGGGVTSPGNWEPATQATAIASWIPGGVDGKTVIDVGSNAGGVGFTLKKLGASEVTLIEKTRLYHRQAELYAEYVGATGVKAVNRSAFEVHQMPPADVVLWLGLAYHFRHTQLFLDYAASCPGKCHVISTQMMPGETLTLRNRKFVYPNHASPVLGWEPTKVTFQHMLEYAGYSVQQIHVPTGPGWTNALYAVCAPPKGATTNCDAAAKILNLTNSWA